MSKLTDLLTSVLEPNDHTGSRPADDSGGNLGEALAKVDFGHTDLGAQGPDYLDAHAALASMSAADALDYAISQMDPGDHLDVGQFDMPVDTSHHT